MIGPRAARAERPSPGASDRDRVATPLLARLGHLRLFRDLRYIYIARRRNEVVEGIQLLSLYLTAAVAFFFLPC